VPPIRVRLCRGPARLAGMALLSPDLTGPVGLALAQAVEQLPGEHGLPGGCRYELKWDGYLH
jgi:ATP-dependent DNA ligase